VTRAGRIALALYLAGVAAITLGQRPDGLFDAGLRAVRDLTGGALSSSVIEAGANVALFVPLGFLLCRSFPAAPRWALWALWVAASASVELYQSLGAGREATVRDVVMNSLGAALGVALSWAVDGSVDRAANRRERARHG
jgi:hypothetical protein